MKFLIYFALALVLAMNSAYAYLDPGSGSAILQGIIGALAAIAITLKLYWHRLLCFLGLRKRIDDSEDEQPDEADQSESRGG